MSKREKIVQTMYAIQSMLAAKIRERAERGTLTRRGVRGIITLSRRDLAAIKLQYERETAKEVRL